MGQCANARKRCEKGERVGEDSKEDMKEERNGNDSEGRYMRNRKELE